jgi:hypothetical protein
VEADRSRADDYYRAEASGLADRLVVYPDGLTGRKSNDRCGSSGPPDIDAGRQGMVSW